MQYMNETIARYRERTEKNSVSLNKTTRVEESEKLIERKNRQDGERKQRYARMAEQDAKDMVIYRLNLSDAADTSKPLPRATKEDEQASMATEDDEEEEIDESPDYPSSLDPELRECLAILRDMIDLR